MMAPRGLSLPPLPSGRPGEPVLKSTAGARKQTYQQAEAGKEKKTRATSCEDEGKKVDVGTLDGGILGERTGGEGPTHAQKQVCAPCSRTLLLLFLISLSIALAWFSPSSLHTPCTPVKVALTISLFFSSQRVLAH